MCDALRLTWVHRLELRTKSTGSLASEPDSTSSLAGTATQGGLLTSVLVCWCQCAHGRAGGCVQRPGAGAVSGVGRKGPRMLRVFRVPWLEGGTHWYTHCPGKEPLLFLTRLQPMGATLLGTRYPGPHPVRQSATRCVRSPPLRPCTPIRIPASRSDAHSCLRRCPPGGNCYQPLLSLLAMYTDPPQMRARVCDARLRPRRERRPMLQLIA
jgi:hypothetical protein